MLLRTYLANYQNIKVIPTWKDTTASDPLRTSQMSCLAIKTPVSPSMAGSLGILEDYGQRLF